MRLELLRALMVPDSLPPLASDRFYNQVFLAVAS